RSQDRGAGGGGPPAFARAATRALLRTLPFCQARDRPRCGPPASETRVRPRGNALDLAAPLARPMSDDAMTMPPPMPPDALAALDELLRPGRADARRMALAVSGGSDSVALMLLVAEWLRARARTLADGLVLTVDHGLRPQSAADAQWVAR